MSATKQFIKGLWKEHPLFRQLIGMCPSLAVTTSFVNGLSMGLAVLFVLCCSSAAISLIRRLVPHQVRIALFTVIIATFVTICDLFMKAYFPAISKALGPFIPLIIVNCIILARAEAFASKNSVGISVIDALGMSGGYAWGLVTLGSLREILGSRTFAGIPILPEAYTPMVIMVLPAGAFLALGFMVALMNKIERVKK